MADLTLQQKKFIDRWIKNGTIRKSAIEAGYSDTYARTQARKILQSEKAQEYIRRRLQQLESDAIADQREILTYLTKVMRGQSESYVVTNEGVILKRPDERDRLKAAELLGKRYSLFTEKIDLNADLGVTIIDNIEADQK